MIVAMHIKSESSDHYLELFVDKTVDEIKQELYDGMEWYYPVSDYDIVFDENTRVSQRQEVESMVSTWYDDSWKYDESEPEENEDTDGYHMP